jgi:hypothetical protein
MTSSTSPNTALSMHFNALQGLTSHQIVPSSPNTSRIWSTDQVRNGSQNGTFDTILYAQHRTISTSPSSQNPWLQLKGIHSSSGPSDITLAIPNISLSEKVRRRRRGNSPVNSVPIKRYSPHVVGNQKKRRRIRAAASPTCHSTTHFFDSHRGKEMHECISHLLLMAEKGEEFILYRHAECIVTSLLSMIEAPTSSSNLQQTYQRALCRHHKEIFDRMESNRMDSIKAIRQLQLAETLEIKRVFHWEWPDSDWEPWFDMFIKFPSQDCGLDEWHELGGRELKDHLQVDMASREISPRGNARTAVALRRRKTSLFSMVSKSGRVDIRTSTHFTVGQPEAYDYAAEEILTLPVIEAGSTQIRFLLSKRETLENSIMFTPLLSIRQMIPDNSKVFQIAATGTLEELVEIFSTGKASWADCDMSGRSLINVGILLGSDLNQS